MRAPTTRREFLKATAAATAALVTARPALSQSNPESDAQETATPTSEGEPGPPRPLTRSRAGSWARETIVLDQPHIVTPASPFLNSSGEIANKRFVLDPKRIAPRGFPTGNLRSPKGVDKTLSAFGMLTLPPGSKNIRIVDCEFEGPWRSRADIPDRKPGVPTMLKGIDMQYASNIRIEGCSFDYLPAEAIYFYGCVGIEIEDVWSTNCTHLVRSDWMGAPRSRQIQLNRLHHADGWGVADLAEHPDYASSYETKRAIGGNAVVGYFVDSQISNLTTSGEVKSAMKLVAPIRVELDRIYTPNLMIQGEMYWNKSDDPAKGNGRVGAYNHAEFDEEPGTHAVDVTISRSRFRPQQNAWSHGLSRNTVQLSYYQERVRFRDCVFYRPDQKKGKFTAIQAWDGVEFDVRDCLFVGWQKPWDPLPPFPKQTILRTGTYGKPGSRPVKVNSDFVRVNRFRR